MAHEWGITWYGPFRITRCARCGRAWVKDSAAPDTPERILDLGEPERCVGAAAEPVEPEPAEEITA